MVVSVILGNTDGQRLCTDNLYAARWIIETMQGTITVSVFGREERCTVTTAMLCWHEFRWDPCCFIPIDTVQLFWWSGKFIYFFLQCSCGPGMASFWKQSSHIQKYILWSLSQWKPLIVLTLVIHLAFQNGDPLTTDRKALGLYPSLFPTYGVNIMELGAGAGQDLSIQELSGITLHPVPLYSGVFPNAKWNHSRWLTLNGTPFDLLSRNGDITVRGQRSDSALLGC